MHTLHLKCEKKTKQNKENDIPRPKTTWCFCGSFPLKYFQNLTGNLESSNIQCSKMQRACREVEKKNNNNKKTTNERTCRFFCQLGPSRSNFGVEISASIDSNLFNSTMNMFNSTIISTQICSVLILCVFCLSRVLMWGDGSRCEVHPPNVSQSGNGINAVWSGWRFELIGSTRCCSDVINCCHTLCNCHKHSRTGWEECAQSKPQGSGTAGMTSGAIWWAASTRCCKLAMFVLLLWQFGCPETQVLGNPPHRWWTYTRLHLIKWC